MRKTFLILTALLLTCTCTLACLKNAGYINVQMQGEEEAKPDTATISIAIETKDANSKVASDKNKEIAKKVMDSINANLTAPKEFINTRAFSVSSQYSYKNGVRTFENYEVTNLFDVKIKDTEKLGKIIDVAMQNGATRVNKLSYSIEDTDEVCNKLIARVSKDAYTRADSTAKALKLKVTKVKQANVSCNVGDYAMPRMYLSKTLSSGANDSTSVPTESNSVKFTATFDGQFYVR